MRRSPGMCIYLNASLHTLHNKESKKEKKNNDIFGKMFYLNVLF